jgi:hypothetical protein
MKTYRWRRVCTAAGAPFLSPSTDRNPMRLPLVCLAALAALTACGPARGARETNAVPTLEPRSERFIRVYEGTTPRCGFREVGPVSGGDYRAVQSAAFRLHANAVILDPQSARVGGVLSGTAVAFTRADCQQ